MRKLDPEVKMSYEVTAVDDTALVLKKNELDSLRQRYTDFNPKVKKLISEVEALTKKLESEKQTKRPAQKITYGKNWQVIRLEEQVFASQTELKNIDLLLEKYAAERPVIQQKLTQLEKTADEYNEIKRRLTLENEMLKKIDKGVTEMNLALSSSACDLRVFEKAEPPLYPILDKRRIKLILGVILGVVLAIICAVILEIVDLTIKSGFDVQHVLHVNVLGSLPKINEVRLKKFYSATQIVFTRIFKADLDKKKKDMLIAFGDVEGGTGKTFFIKKMY